MDLIAAIAGSDPITDMSDEWLQLPFPADYVSSNFGLGFAILIGVVNDR